MASAGRLEHPSFDPKRCSSLKSIIAGGAPVPPAQVETMRKKAKGVNSGQGYGMTESMGLGTINRGADYLKRPTSCASAYQAQKPQTNTIILGEKIIFTPLSKGSLI